SKLDIMSIAATPWFVPDTTSLKDQLAEFLRRKAQMALVVDEYGEVQGLITLEDILEEIVGQITDEHDATESRIRPQ
ncbi:CBS domain-containing protein, partial [Escherichia coli]|nr:CBS domain-containing protein [Escherichia coli]